MKAKKKPEWTLGQNRRRRYYKINTEVGKGNKQKIQRLDIHINFNREVSGLYSFSDLNILTRAPGVNDE